MRPAWRARVAQACTKSSPVSKNKKIEPTNQPIKHMNEMARVIEIDACLKSEHMEAEAGRIESCVYTHPT